MNRRGIKRPLPGTPAPSFPCPSGAETVELHRRTPKNRSHPPTYGSGPRCYWCSRRWKTSALRLVGIIGIQMLGFMTCPCRGFKPPRGDVGIIPDRPRTRGSDRRTLVCAGDGLRAGDLKCIRVALGEMGAPRGRGLKRRRGRRRRRCWWWPGNGDGLSTDEDSSTACCATRLPVPSDERGRPTGLLYDGTLLRAGARVADASNSRRDDVAESGETSTASATTTEDGDAFARVAVEDTEWSSPKDGAATNLTERWARVVDGVLADISQGIESQQQQPAARRKWSGKGWMGIGASWRAGEGWAGQREGDQLKATAIQVDRSKDAVLPTNATALLPSLLSTVDGLESRVVEFDAPERSSWRVWQGPMRRVTLGLEEEEDEMNQGETEECAGGIYASGKAELTLYLLEMGATHYEVADASAALFATEPETALTRVTWRRWRRNLDGLTSTGFSGSDVANMLILYPRLLALDFEGQVVPAMELLRGKLGMRPTDMRRVIRKAPEVLAPRPDGSTASEAVEVLKAIGFQTRQVRAEALRWPQMLAVPPANFFQLAAFLSSGEVGIKAAEVGSLVRQAPWLSLERIDGQMVPVVRFLRRAGVTDLERVVRAYPKILCASVRGELAPRVRFLWETVGVSQEDLPRVLQSFPLLFALPLSRMQDMVDFLAVDLYINNRDIAKIIRAFPSLLGLERERHMEGVVRYLKNLGVQNVGRFVSRLPPVLGYDVRTNLMPKMNYLVEKMGLSVYDVLTFPAFFSYPLDTVIEPRTEFLNIRGRPVTLVGLNIALQQGDSDFSRKVAKVQPKIYREFKEAYLAGRELVKSGETEAESLLSEKQRKAIGNIGGQSTSNNVKEVTARATGLPPNQQPSKDDQ